MPKRMLDSIRITNISTALLILKAIIIIRLWSFIKSKHKDQCGIPFSTKNSELIADSLKANVFNDYFSSIFTQENTNLLPNLYGAPLPYTPKISVSVMALPIFLTHKATGPDEITAYTF